MVSLIFYWNLLAKLGRQALLFVVPSVVPSGRSSLQFLLFWSNFVTIPLWFCLCGHMASQIISLGYSNNLVPNQQKLQCWATCWHPTEHLKEHRLAAKFTHKFTQNKIVRPTSVLVTIVSNSAGDLCDLATLLDTFLRILV